MDKFLKLKTALGSYCRLNEKMTLHTTVGIGGPAKLYLEAKSTKELLRAFKKAEKIKIPCLVIGEGSNLLVSDEGFRGLVIHNQAEGIIKIGKRFRVKSGTKLQKFIDFVVEQGARGVEKLVGIPGTVGGAIWGNAGAFGQEISDFLLRVLVFDRKKTKWLTKENCAFGYRESIFQKKKWLILEAEFCFPEGDPLELKKEVEEILRFRRERFSAIGKSPGSFFKNVSIKDVPEEIVGRIPKEKIKSGKIPAGYLIEKVRMKGQRRGKIQVSPLHGNIIVNHGGGKAADFYQLAKICEDKVRKKFKIELEPEVCLVGFQKSL